METTNENEESGEYLYYDEAVKVNLTLFDHTNEGPTYYSTRLNGTASEQYGLAKSFSVMPGDTVLAEVYVKYLDPNPSNWTTALANFMSAVAGGTAPPGTIVDGGAAGSAGGAAPMVSLFSGNTENGSAPKAYLNYVVFAMRDSLTFVNSGAVRVTENAREYGQDGPHERLALDIPIETAGLVYIWLSNDYVELGGTHAEVYFDDFKVMLQKSPVINATDLYPYGAPAISYSREFSLKQDRILNGKETQDELGFNVVDLGQRDIDPYVPVFPTIDRFAEKYSSMSPYQYTAGNPAIYVDLNGDSLWIKYKGNNVLYEDGRLYTVSNGQKTEYSGPGVKRDKKTGEVVGYKGFLGRAYESLNEISAAEAAQTGTTVMCDLQSSTNNFYIDKASNNPRAPGQNEFKEDNTSAAYAVAMLDARQGRPQSGGSGGTIYWNPKSGSVNEVGGRLGTRPTTNLAHELFHGWEADQGLLDNRPINGLKRSEGRAVFYENMMRRAMNFPYRESYNLRTGPVPTLDASGQPINVPPPSITWLYRFLY